MKIRTIIIHNFRSIKDATFNMKDYSMLVGENNAGKTNIINALRMFYEDGGLKFKDDIDFPKFDIDDKESWIEIHFALDDTELNNIKKEYITAGNLLKVRRYFKHANLVNSKQSNIYGYENGHLSENLFYGAKNISEAKLGHTIYIPDISLTKEIFKTTGPSPFRDILSFVFGKILSNSETFNQLTDKFTQLNKEFKSETSDDGISPGQLIYKINKEIEKWNIKFDINIDPIGEDNIIKLLLNYSISDKTLNNDLLIDSFGQGFQRTLIYTIIKLSSEYNNTKANDKSSFSPDFTLLLFEEPEAFLHPSQQMQLNYGLEDLSKKVNNQILISTHSPIFVSKNITNLDAIIKLKKEDTVTTIFQLGEKDIKKLWGTNVSLYKIFSDIIETGTYKNKSKEEVKKLIGEINDKHLGGATSDIDNKIDEESIKYFLWIDSERASAFFAKHIIICEGATEKIAFEYMINKFSIPLPHDNIYILDAMGKFNIHRYVTLFSKFGITHSILYDEDEDKSYQEVVNTFIQENKSAEFTKCICTFPKDFEDYLGIQKPQHRKDLKPLNVLMALKNDEISSSNLEKVKDLIKTLAKSS